MPQTKYIHVPGFWMAQTSGVLRPAVEAYLAGSMSPEQIAAMRAYLRQWIGSPVWDQNPYDDQGRAREVLGDLRSRIDGLTSVGAIRIWIADAMTNGIDPL